MCPASGQCPIWSFLAATGCKFSPTCQFSLQPLRSFLLYPADAARSPFSFPLITTPLSFYLHPSHFLFYLFFHRFVCMSTSPVIQTSTCSGCVVSGLHSGRDDQGKCVVPRHWSYPSPVIDCSLCHHFILCEEVQHHPEECPPPPVTLLSIVNFPTWHTLPPSLLCCNHLLWKLRF